MGYGGKVQEQRRARELRAQAWTLAEIAAELGVSKSSVSLWVRDVEFVPKPRRHSTGPRRPSSLQLRKLADIERCRLEGIERIGQLSEREFLILGLALYAGEGAKTGSEVKFANSDPSLVYVFVSWLRHFFEVDETRFHLSLYLHEHLDLEAANEFWSDLTDIPISRFYKPYRAVADPSIRKTKHLYGCPAVRYCSASVHRRVMGMVAAVTSRSALSGVAQLEEQGAVNAKACGFEPHPRS